MNRDFNPPRGYSLLYKHIEAIHLRISFLSSGLSVFSRIIIESLSILFENVMRREIIRSFRRIAPSKAFPPSFPNIFSKDYERFSYPAGSKIQYNLVEGYPPKPLHQDRQFDSLL
jgi:hypothetical protein